MKNVVGIAVGMFLSAIGGMVLIVHLTHATPRAHGLLDFGDYARGRADQRGADSVDASAHYVRPWVIERDTVYRTLWLSPRDSAIVKITTGRKP